MKVCVSKFVLGTDKHLIHERESNNFYWSRDVPAIAWFYGNAPRATRSLNDLCMMFNIHPRDKPDDKFVRSFTNVGVPAGLSVPWHECLPRDVFQKYITELLEDLWMALDRLHDTTYEGIFLNNREALVSLFPAKVCVEKLKKFEKSEVNPSQMQALNSFSPNLEGDMLKTPVYQQGGTGRTTVKTGPRILTLKREYRDVIVSRFPGGKIVQLDYSALEPRVMLAICDKVFNGDVYEFLSDKMSINLNRARLKMAVMGSLYGISQGKLQTILGRDVDAGDVSESIKDFFGIRPLARRLLKQCENGNEIRNYYDRPLFFTRCDPHLLVSHYVQSTGVDVALSGFKSVIDYIDSEGLSAKPIFVIHDALILDVPADEIDKINQIKNAGETISKFGCDFPITVSDILGEEIP